MSFVYPPVCQICESERAGARDGFVCHDCQRRVRWIAPPFCETCGLPFEGEISSSFDCANCHDVELHFRFARSAVVANDLILEIIHRYKYNGKLWFGEFLAEVMIQKAAPALAAEKWDLIVPVPLHSAKQREREFNQTEHLARRLGEATGIPLNVRLVKRVKSTATQTLLGKRERAANMKDAFALRGKRLDGARVVLVDDVLTTGATTSACAQALREAGAGDVCVWTVARGA